MNEALRNRLESKIQTDPNTGCWLWTGGINKNGYAEMHTTCSGKDRKIGVHRLTYEEYKAPIPPGETIDHYRRNLGLPCQKHCVNPEHLESVPRIVNTLRFMRSINPRYDTHCLKGHPKDLLHPWMKAGKYMGCRVCRSAKKRRYEAKRRQTLRSKVA